MNSIKVLPVGYYNINHFYGKPSQLSINNFLTIYGLIRDARCVIIHLSLLPL